MGKQVFVGTPAPGQEINSANDKRRKTGESIAVPEPAHPQSYCQSQQQRQSDPHDNAVK